METKLIARTFSFHMTAVVAFSNYFNIEQKSLFVWRCSWPKSNGSFEIEMNSVEQGSVVIKIFADFFAPILCVPSSLGWFLWEKHGSYWNSWIILIEYSYSNKWYQLNSAQISAHPYLLSLSHSNDWRQVTHVCFVGHISLSIDVDCDDFLFFLADAEIHFLGFGWRNYCQILKQKLITENNAKTKRKTTFEHANIVNKWNDE